MDRRSVMTSFLVHNGLVRGLDFRTSYLTDLFRPEFTEIFDIMDKMHQQLTDEDTMPGYEGANTLED